MRATFASVCVLLSGATLLAGGCDGNSSGGDAATSGSSGVDAGGANAGAASGAAGTDDGGTNGGSIGKAGSSGAAGSTMNTGGTAGMATGGVGAGGGTTGGNATGGAGNGGAGTSSGGTGGRENGGDAGVGNGGIAGRGSGGAGNGGGAGKANGGSAGAGGCAMNCSTTGLSCCASRCTNTDNDVKNCGTCGHECPGTFPYCDNGTCGTPPCTSTSCGAGSCCDTQCCSAGQLCCVVPGGPLGPPRCVAPVNDSCPPGCPNCPCASPDTPIATPSGERPISLLRPGDLVYSIDDEAVTAVPIKSVNVNPVVGHHVLRLVLASGVVLEISAMHPTADGRTLATLGPGGTLDGVKVLSVEQVPYAHASTYDILPDSDTGTYYAGGVLLGSTLWRPPPGR